MPQLRNKHCIKIICFAGGGIFGYSQAYFLNSLQTNVADHVDVMGGTSIGSCIALSLANGATSQRIYNLFDIECAKIFNPSFISRLNPFGALHNDKLLNENYRKLMPKTLGELNTYVVIPTLDFIQTRPKIYDNIVNYDDMDIPSWEIARMSSSAPTYFKPWAGHIDGGLFENIPIHTTVSTILNKIPGARMEDMCIFAIGTGRYDREPRTENFSQWTAMQWLKPMMGLLTESNEMATVFWAKQMPFKYFKYYNPIMLNENWHMDDPACLQNIKAQCICNQDIFLNTFMEFIDVRA